MSRITFAVFFLLMAMFTVGCGNSSPTDDKDTKKDGTTAPGTDLEALKANVEAAKAKLEAEQKLLAEAEAKAGKKADDPKVDPKTGKTDPKVDPKADPKDTPATKKLVAVDTFETGGFEVVDGPNKGTKLSISADKVGKVVYFSNMARVTFKKFDAPGNFAVDVTREGGLVNTSKISVMGGYTTLKYLTAEEMKKE